MQKADMEFFDEYKRLDRLCSDMYSCSNGVTEYITQMEKNAGNGRNLVAGWDNDYRMLKHVRWVRNQIAHEAENHCISEASDLKSVRGFYDRVSSGKDPLAMLEKGNGSFIAKLFRRLKADGHRNNNIGHKRRGKKSKLKRILLLLMFVIAVIVILTLIK